MHTSLRHAYRSPANVRDESNRNCCAHLTIGMREGCARNRRFFLNTHNHPFHVQHSPTVKSIHPRYVCSFSILSPERGPTKSKKHRQIFKHVSGTGSGHLGRMARALTLQILHTQENINGVFIWKLRFLSRVITQTGTCSTPFLFFGQVSLCSHNMILNQEAHPSPLQREMSLARTGEGG